jgi:restriction system protein
MTIPSFNVFMLPALRLLSQETLHIRTITERLSKEFSLTDEERGELLPSGTRTKVADRVSWAISYLNAAEFIKRVERGVYGITEVGNGVLATNPEKIDVPFLTKHSESFRQFQNRSTGKTGEDVNSPAIPVTVLAEQETPEERIGAAFSELNIALRNDLLERIMGLGDTDFERLIVALMLGLGYGARGLGKSTQRSRDGGIDGIITEDILGLDVIYLQAKRNSPENHVGSPKIHEFLGALDSRGITKGVFVTTSSFTKDAMEVAERSPKHLRLIDGEQLAQLMIKHGIGVRENKTWKQQTLDQDFFEGLTE